MRLINAKTLNLEEFFGKQTPRYAILSHTWGSGEISLQDFRAAAQTETATWARTAGFTKVLRTCSQTLESGLSHVWIDTCCIDKTNNAELSEAINSMFRWYNEAQVCFAYLADVPPRSHGDVHDEAFRGSRWFTRGWTLQELLAPKCLVFFASNWSIIADRHEMASWINEVTQIQVAVLQDSPVLRSDWRSLLSLDFTEDDIDIDDSRQSKLRQVSAAEKISWAANRDTTREEDIAYCLLGIFDINMPLMYGEGMHAFARLQREIIQQLSDLTILAWNSLHDNKALSILKEPSSSAWRSVWDMLLGIKHPWYHDRFLYLSDEDIPDFMNLLAPNPKVFSSSHQLVPINATPELALTTKGLHINLPLSEDWLSWRLPFTSRIRLPSLLLPCQPRDDPWSLVSLPLISLKNGVYGRLNSPIQLVSHRKWSMWPRKSIDLLVYDSNTIGRSPPRRQKLWIRHLSSNVRLIDIHVGIFDRWLADSQTIQLRPSLTDLRKYHGANTVFALILVECIKSGQRFIIVSDVWQPPSYALPVMFPGCWWINHHFVPFDYITKDKNVLALFKSLNSYRVAKLPKYREDRDGLIHAHITYEHIFGEPVCALDITHIPHGYRAETLKRQYDIALLLRKRANYLSEVFRHLCYAFGDVLPYHTRLPRTIPETVQRWFEMGLAMISFGCFWIYWTFRNLPYPLPSSTESAPKTVAEKTTGSSIPQGMPSPNTSFKPFLQVAFHLISVFYMLIPIIAYIGPSSSEILRSKRAILSFWLSLVTAPIMYHYRYASYGIFLMTMYTQHRRLQPEIFWDSRMPSRGFYLLGTYLSLFCLHYLILRGWLRWLDEL